MTSTPVDDDKNQGDAQQLVRLIRDRTEAQFDYWIASLNEAAADMGETKRRFTSDDRQKTISYWYVLMYLLEIYAGEHNPFIVRRGEVWMSEGLITMQQLTDDLQKRFKFETTRRYISELKRYRLLTHEGRGPEARVKLSAAAIVALTGTVQQWITAFRDLDCLFTKFSGELPAAS
jgi:hypothetical protein